MELGLSPEQFLSLTVNELNALDAHRKREEARQERLAAFSGYCAAAAVAKWWTEGLPGFKDFYVIPDPKKSAPQSPELKDHIEMMRRAGEGGPPVN